MQDTGRIKKYLLDDVQALLSEEKNCYSKEQELNYMMKIDQAHIIMLLSTGFLNNKTAIKLLTGIQQLDKKALLRENSPRGLFYSYIDILTKNIGSEFAGKLHSGRSRNDLNATIFKLYLRDEFFKVNLSLLQLRKTLSEIARANKEILIPIYSQYQLAQASNVAHYYLGINNALKRDQIAFLTLTSSIHTMPLGSCAGVGTTVHIDQIVTAKLLGFNEIEYNALDAIASRDSALRILSTISISAINLSRLIEDLQLWSMCEISIIEFPDELAGGSSLMPQKKNPYLLEKLKGMLISASQQFNIALMTMTKVPFGNSVEVGTEAIKPVKIALDKFIRAIKLINIIIKRITFNGSVIEKLNSSHFLDATYYSELLSIHHGKTIHDAHHMIGNMITNNFNKRSKLSLNDELGIKDNTSLKDIISKYEYGNGPGKKSIEKQLLYCNKKIDEHKIQLNNIIDAHEKNEISRNKRALSIIKNSQT